MTVPRGLTRLTRDRCSVPEPSVRRPVVLVVDDTEANRYAVARQLRANGFDVLEAPTGQGGLDLAIARLPDLVVLDVRLPDMSGFDVAQRLRADGRTAGIPVLHLSASFTDSVSQAHGLDNGADGYLTHPVDPLVMLATVRSLIRAHAAEWEAHAAARDWSATFGAIGEGVCITDMAGKVLRCNQAFIKLVGGVDVEGGASSITDLLPGLAQAAEESGTLMPEEGFGWRLEVNGRWLRITSVPVTERGAEPPAMVWVVTDVTRERRADERARLALQLESTGRLAGGVAHEINNMMTVILAGADFAMRSLGPDEPLREEIDAIQQAATRSAEVARQLLTFSRRQILKPRAVDFHALLQASESMIRRLLGADRTLRMQLDAARPWVKVDPLGMEQVIINLALNARDAMPQGGEVTVATSNVQLGGEMAGQHPEIAIHQGPYVQVAITDTGFGMDAATRDRIFEPFFTTKGVGEGTGLGLATVFGMVKQSEGYIWVESEPGRGTTFRLQLPEVAAPEAESGPGDEAPTPPRGLGTVLLVEDEPLVQGLLQRTLRDAGFGVEVGRDGEEALEILVRRGSRISALVTDVVMPHMGGRELARRLRERWPEVPVLFMSGYTNEEVTRRGLLAEGEAFIQKPFSPTAFMAAVFDLMARGTVIPS